MGMAFHSVEDKRMKLHNTICMWKGKPYMVNADQAGQTVVLQTLAGRAEPKAVKYTDDDFDYRSVPLGYVNYGINALYLVRLPTRQNRQGLNPEQMRIVGNQRFAIYDFLNTKNMESCILGEHPPFEEALRQVTEGEAASRAFHRHCSIKREGSRIALEYRGRIVGYKDRGNGTFVLIPSNEYSFLRVILDKAGAKVC
jgi:hypothetical protein